MKDMYQHISAGKLIESFTFDIKSIIGDLQSKIYKLEEKIRFLEKDKKPSSTIHDANLSVRLYNKLKAFIVSEGKDPWKYSIFELSQVPIERLKKIDGWGRKTTNEYQKMLSDFNLIPVK